ncbi:MAG TPA: isochorismatase family protein [Caldimonas sp.]
MAAGAGAGSAANEARIHKRFASSFEETDLEAELARFAATHIALAGAQSNWCIRATAYAALDRGYDLTLIEDAHTTNGVKRADGTAIVARDIVDDLNVAMTWLSYPSRTSATATAEEVDFAGSRVPR